MAARGRRRRPGGGARACRAIGPSCATTAAGLRRRLPDRGDHDCGPARRGRRLDVDYGRCVVCQLCTEACPTGAMSRLARLGVRRARREDLVWAERAGAGASRARRRRTAGVPPQPAHPPCRRRLLQRLRVRAAGAEQSVLQSAPARHLLHAVAALRRSAAGHRAGDPCDAASRCAPPTRRCRSRAG